MSIDSTRQPNMSMKLWNFTKRLAANGPPGWVWAGALTGTSVASAWLAIDGSEGALEFWKQAGPEWVALTTGSLAAWLGYRWAKNGRSDA